MKYMLFSLNFYDKPKFSVYFVLKPLEKVQNTIFRSQNGSKHAFSKSLGIPSIFELETWWNKPNVWYKCICELWGRQQWQYKYKDKDKEGGHVSVY